MAGETSPLLTEDRREHHEPPPRPDEALPYDNEVEDKIPVVQLSLLCYARAMDGIAYFCIFPFINEMIWRTPNVRRTDTGFYSGLIEALFAVTQIACMPLWARGVGRFRRKSLVAVSLVGVALANMAFGFSTAIWQMICIRCIAGVFSASAPVLRIMFFDISTPQTEARIFALFPLANNFGMFFGPLIGGLLADPVAPNTPAADMFPILVRYPYALATIAAGIIMGSAALTTWLFVDEPAPRVIDSEESGSHDALSLMKKRNVASALFIFASSSFIAIGFTAVLPAFMFSTVEDGGYGFSPSQISAFIALSGVSQAAWALFAYPPLDRRFDRPRLIRYCYYGWPLFFLLGPFCNFLLKHNSQTAFWTIAPLGIVFFNYISIVFSAMGVLVNDVAPSKQALEVLNVLALVALSIARAGAPGLFGAVYAAGARNQILAGEFVWVFFILLWMPTMLVLQFFPPSKTETKLDTVHSNDGTQR